MQKVEEGAQITCQKEYIFKVTKANCPFFSFLDRTPEQLCFWITDQYGNYDNGKTRCAQRGGVPAEVYSADEDIVVKFV